MQIIMPQHKNERKIIMKTSKKILCVVFSLMIAALSVCAQFASLSPALDVIKDSIELKKCGVAGQNVAFSPADFDKVLKDHVDFVTITSLPENNDGRLVLDGVNVMENQTIARRSLDKLCFVPEGDTAVKTQFYFADALDGELSGKCTVNVLDEINLCPETGDQTVFTQKNIAAFKFLMAADPEDDALCFDVVSYPKNGSIDVNSTTGVFRYIPEKGFVGQDYFSYTVSDVYGNTSLPQTVNVNVTKPSSDVYFDDMRNHWAHNSAVKMASTGLMPPEEVDGKTVFSPDSGITRGDFLAISLIMCGYEEKIPETAVTDFADDELIPRNIKSYAQYAYEKGIVSGYSSPQGAQFKSGAPITRAEAAVIVDKLLSLPKADKMPQFSDAASIPSWADSSVASLTACGILNGTGGGQVDSQSSLTKGQAAEMICNVAQYLEDKENQINQQEKPKKSIFNLFGLLG